MNFEQPKPDSKKYSDLISDIEKGIIKIPKFQREFVWGIDKTAKLLDSILKGYPIGTFILWKTDERKKREDSVFYRDSVVILLGVLVTENETSIPRKWPVDSGYLEDFYNTLGISTSGLF